MLIEWLNYISTEVHKAYAPFFSPATPEDYKKIALENLYKKLTFLNQTLEKNDYLMGRYSVADAYLFTVLNWSKAVKADLSKYPALVKFQERVQARPAVQSAMKREGLIN